MSHTAILTALPFYQYIGAGLPLFILLYIFYIFISIPLSQSPPLSIFLTILSHSEWQQTKSIQKGEAQRKIRCVSPYDREIV